MTISDLLIPILKERFPNSGLQIGTAPDPIAVFPPKHPLVGNVSIMDEGDEALIYIGEITHVHFNDYDEELSPEEHLKAVVNMVVDYLEELFNDHVLLWGSGKGTGGSRGQFEGVVPEDIPKREKLFVWSGPIDAVKRVPLDLNKLSGPSSKFSLLFFEAHPELQQYASMIMDPNSQEQFDLSVKVPSPTGDPERVIDIWVENGEPSLGFGAWHAHFSFAREKKIDDFDGLIDILEAILSDVFVLVYDFGGEYDGSCDVVDLRDPEALAEYLTGRYSSGAADIRSWGGSADRRVDLDDL